MKNFRKFLNLVIGMALAAAGTVFAEPTYVPVSLTMNGTQSTSFEVYPDETSTTPLASLNLSDGGYDINANVKYVAGKIYLEVTPGNTGNWYLVIFTANEERGYPNESNHLYATDGSSASLQWKYRTQLRHGYDSSPLGTVISGNEWVGYSSDPKYLYMWNVPPGQEEWELPEENYAWASIVNYMNAGESVLPDTRLQVVFGVDLSTSWRAATYTGNLAFEVYYVE